MKKLLLTASLAVGSITSGFCTPVLVPGDFSADNSDPAVTILYCDPSSARCGDEDRDAGTFTDANNYTWTNVTFDLPVGPDDPNYESEIIAAFQTFGAVTANPMP